MNLFKAAQSVQRLLSLLANSCVPHLLFFFFILLQKNLVYSVKYEMKF